LADKKPYRLLITETQVNILVLVSTHDSTFRGRDPGDVHFDLVCRTWQDPKVRSAPAISTSDGGKGQVVILSARPDTKPVAKVYKVRSGDTLTAIAKLQLGDSSKWR